MDPNQPSDQRIVASVLENLDLAVLTRAENPAHGAFRLVGQAPEWFASCFGSETSMLQRSAFLEDFVHGAASDCWKAAGAPARSGMWEESTAEGTARYFEATALKRGNEEVLVVALADERHRRERKWIQHVHDETLHQRRLAREREKKEILLDCIVHDLSSPLSTMLMNIQHVERQLDRDDLRQSLHRAVTQAERQRALIHSVAHTFASELSNFEPVLLARSTGVAIGMVAGVMVDAFKVTVEQANVRVELDVDPAIDEGVRVIGDVDHLAGVFDNLLSDALRRSPEKSKITVTIRSREGRVRTSVDDEGAAITAEARERIFEPFARRNGETEGAAGKDDASGLGLYFCKMTVELWGGSIGVNARPGGGNQFWFDLPVHRAPPEDEAT